MKIRRLFLSVITVMIAGGCTMAPKYHRPDTPVPEQWPGGAAYSAVPFVADALEASQIKWQDFFTDPKLQKVIEIALQNNRDLRLAALNTERARGFYGVRRADLLPVINADGGGGERQMSADFVAPGASRTLKQYEVNLGVTAWEIDFFGRIRSLEKQALEEYLDTEEARRSAQIALVSEVARTYFGLAAEKSNFHLAEATLKAQEGMYHLIRRRYELNIANEIDLRRVQTQVDAARGDVAYYTQRMAQAENALNFLAGTPVPENLLPVDLSRVKPLKDVAPGLSSGVLLRRPDIMAAEHRLKGAYANIGAARAAFFPRISLTTTLGSASSELSGLFKAGTATWLYAPQLVMPVFDARTWSAYRVSSADREIALTQYEKAIQTAFREVADVLAVRGTLGQQLEAQQSLVDSSEKIYVLSEKRYEGGIDNYLSVLDAQRSFYRAQHGLIALQVAQLANEAQVYAALGGGVDYSEEAEVSLLRKFFRFFRF
jgi:multidrug efflux system outer membrane protein